MKIFKIAGIIVILLALLVLSYLLYFKTTHTPVYSGEIKLTGLENSVDVFYTDHGIPHIYASNDLDAYYALGYVHAQDRLWQMDLLRHVGSGTLSELFGEDLVGSDKFLRTMGLAKYAKESAEAYLRRDHESLPLTRAYINGINGYIENNPKTLEHTVLQVEVEPFTIEHTFQVLAYMAFSFSNAYKTDPFVAELSAKLDSSYITDLQLYHYRGETVLRNHDNRYSLLSLNADQVAKTLRVPEFVGSNSWVLSKDKTSTGNVILANDPHIAFSQPAVWYEAHLTTPKTEYYGYHLGAIPYPLILHTPNHANGLTMFENDDMDFYVEEIHPEDSNQYRYKGEWVAMDSRTELIHVKGGDPVEFTVRSTKHGPIVSDILKEEPLEDIVSMYWVNTNFENFALEATHGFTRAANLEEFEQAVAKIHGPGLNVMYGDKDGNVAWWATGKLIKRRNELTSKNFYDGSTGLDDPDEMYPFEKNPHAINPDWGYVYSANNQPDTVDGVVYSGYYLPDDRGERIDELIQNNEAFGVGDMKGMLLDSRSKLFENVKGILLHAVKDTEEIELLRGLISWKADFNKADYQPLVYQKWIYEIMEGAMKDEMGEDLWEAYKGTHTYKIAIEHLVKNEQSKWWDNVETDETETRIQIIREAFDRTVSDLRTYWGDDYTQWKWGDGHQLKHNHGIGTVLGFLNVGPFGVSGGNEVINNLGFTYTGEKLQPITFGPSTRRIVDFSDIRNNSWSILPTGQSGNYFSPYYDDQAEMYANGQFRRMIMNEKEIRQSENKLVLQPND